MSQSSRIPLMILTVSLLALLNESFSSLTDAASLPAVLLTAIVPGMFLLRFRNAEASWSWWRSLLLTATFFCMVGAVVGRLQLVSIAAVMLSASVLLSTYNIRQGRRSLVHLMVFPVVLMSPPMIDLLYSRFQLDELAARISSVIASSSGRVHIRDGISLAVSDFSFNVSVFREQLFGSQTLLATLACWSAWQWRSIPQFLMTLPAAVAITFCTTLICSTLCIAAIGSSLSEPWPHGFTAFVAYLVGAGLLISADALTLFLTSPIPVEEKDPEDAYRQGGSTVWINPLVTSWNRFVAAVPAKSPLNPTSAGIPRWIQWYALTLAILALLAATTLPSANLNG